MQKLPQLKQVRRGGNTWRFSASRYFRKRHSKKYADRFVQGVDYEEIQHPLYKYRMICERVVKTQVYGRKIITEFFVLYKDGRLRILGGYCWDGPSGPTIDTPSFMRSSAVHDVLFQILREGRVADGVRRDFFLLANSELRRISKIDGMWWPRYDIVKFAVDKFGAKHAAKNKELVA